MKALVTGFDPFAGEPVNPEIEDIVRGIEIVLRVAAVRRDDIAAATGAVWSSIS